MLSIKKAEYTGGYKIHLTFNDGKEGTANLEKTILKDKRPIFSRLKSETNFRKFKVAHSTVVWSDELDLAPEYLFYLAFKEDDHFQDQFRQWGYIV